MFSIDCLEPDRYYKIKKGKKKKGKKENKKENKTKEKAGYLQQLLLNGSDQLLDRSNVPSTGPWWERESIFYLSQ